MDLSRYFREEVVRDALVLYAEPGSGAKMDTSAAIKDGF